MSRILNNRNKRLEHKKFSSNFKEKEINNYDSLKPIESDKREFIDSFKNSNREIKPIEFIKDPPLISDKEQRSEEIALPVKETSQALLSYAEHQKLNKQQNLLNKDQRILSRDRWLARNGHNLTYAGIFLFTLVLYFRPYEMIPALSSFTSMALWIAIATILVYIPTQFSLESSLTNLPIEIKCILALAFFSILSVPIAVSPSLAWTKFSEDYVKIILIFIVMVNTLRTKSRVKGLMWLAIGIGVIISYQAIDLYRKGEFAIDGYRVKLEMGGMFGNPNDLALHLVIFTPIAVVLGIASRNKIAKLLYFTATGMMVAGTMVTQSRGSFLGLFAVAAVLVWKLGRKDRLKTIITSSIVGLVVIALAPGNYGLRLLSIFYPELDTVGSSDQRRELLIQSFWVSLRNPLGVGIGNFPVIGLDNKETHNAFTQISSEIGLFAFAAYMILLISPLRKLNAIERRLFAQKDFSWIYYLSIGIQTSIAGYMVSSFFAPVAYDWFVYYPVAYAVALRRIYQLEQAEKAIVLPIKASQAFV